MEITKQENNKFKTNEIAVFLTIPLKKETITKNALIPAVLRRGTANLKNQIEIGKKLENMYGAFFNCGVDKTGNYCVLRFHIATLSDRFLPNKENLAQDGMNLLMDIIFNPLVENGGFCEEYVEQEKENLRKIINSKKDNKQTYALERGIEEMFEEDAYGIYKYGYEEDLDTINAKRLYEHYKKILQEAKINVIINGIDASKVEVPEEIKNAGNDFELDIRNNPHQGDVKEVKEKLDVTQGKLIIGLEAATENKFAVRMYNAILGGGANSKLFQNVREKASLAYSAGSKYITRKDAIFIITGIELANYNKALKIIKEQIEDMRSGNITDDEFEKAQQLLVSSLNLVKESQDDIIAFEFDKKLFNENLSIDESISKLKEVNKNDIIEVAKQIKMNTIYYLEK